MAMVMWVLGAEGRQVITWVKLALSLFFFGVQAFVYAIIAEDRKPLFGVVARDDDGYVVCQFPRLTVAMGSLSLVSLLLAVLLGHLAVFYPYASSSYSSSPPSSAAVPRRALLRSTTLIVFFIVAELVSASALAMLLGATIAQARHASGDVVQYQPQTLSCRSTPKTDGHFGGGALLALDAALMWFVCQLLALEARANYLDLHDHHRDLQSKDSKMKKEDDAVFADHA